ncbi:MAG: hypothetical protein IKB38_04050 [Clostridia bacterium]|nr:hypothetical protein [Clostridia bacterium]
MIFYESVCFDITITGEKAHVSKLIAYMKSGELDDVLVLDDEYFSFDDEYETAAPDAEVCVSVSEEFGAEVDEFNSDEFLELLCKAAKNVHLKGNFYNFDDEEIRFVSEIGDSYYTNADNITFFNDELDEEAAKEAAEEDEDEY